MQQGKRLSVMEAVAATIVVLVILLSMVYVLTDFLKIPFNLARFVNAGLVAVVIYVILRLLTRFISSYLSRFTKVSRIHPLIFLINILGYFIMGVAVLGVIGVNVTSLILGGSLVTVIIGLASQTVLANQFAGILLTVTRPFKVGDLVTINTWQYGGTFPTLFPKYFSVDRIEATAYTGTVRDLTINYTVMALTSGDTVKLPNGVIVQAAVIVRSPGILVRTRYEVPKHILFNDLKPLVEEAVKSMNDFESLSLISVDETTLNTYILMITAKFKGLDADYFRGKILEKLMEIVEPMKS